MSTRARKRCLMIGAGGMAEEWIHRILPRFDGRLEVVGLVDVSPTALAASGDFLELGAAHRFTSMQTAFEAVAADFCVVVVPAAFHADGVQAAKRGLAILCEKPLADTWPACREIYQAVRAANVKMQVVQNYRYGGPMLAMRSVLRSEQLGRINYVVSRFSDDCRAYNTWQRRHELPNAMLVDSAAHHFDMLRNLTGGDCAQMTALEWNPPWSSSTGEFCALCLMLMSNDTRATHEGNATAGGEQNAWRHEYYRAECEDGSVTVGNDQIVRIHRHARPGRRHPRSRCAAAAVRGTCLDRVRVSGLVGRRAYAGDDARRQHTHRGDDLRCDRVRAHPTDGRRRGHAACGATLALDGARRQPLHKVARQQPEEDHHRQ
ncbi:MAG TPA: Gfo/Idh/MocA family oxidoreductase [Ktedonobacterales bacterium]|nr:Gfo/Idh/MocA family oxidoreductase [Ktedonobacterales bacterium]